MTGDSDTPAHSVEACMSVAEVKAMLAGIVEAFDNQDVEALASGWTEDIVIRFADFPEIRGKAAAKQWMASRFKRQKGYVLKKSFQAVCGDIVGDSWTGEWTDALSGKKMRGRGMEFLTMRGGKIAVWEAVFNAWEEGSEASVPIT